jgi:hypothetical protein
MTSLLNSNKKMKIVFFGIVACICSALTVRSEKVNFSGMWAINLQKSEFGEAPPTTAFKQLRVEQKTDSIIIEGSNTKSNGETFTSVSKNSLDGKTFERISVENRKVKASVQWTDNMKTLTRNASYSFIDNYEQEEYTRKETWFLSENGRELNINVNVIYSTGFAYEIKIAYDKK